MSQDAVTRWEEKITELFRNRRHRVPKDWTREDNLTRDLEVILPDLTGEERQLVRWPQPPVKPDLIAHDSDGHLIGYEECRCPPESKETDRTGIVWDEDSPDWFGGSE